MTNAVGGNQAMSHDIEAQVRRVLQRIDHEITETNRRKFDEHVGEVHHADFLRLAEAVATLRVEYLKTMLTADGAGTLQDHAAWAKKLQAHRLAYSEAMSGFNELRHALERGYFTLLD